MATRILFYVKRNLHLPHVEPILRWLLDNEPTADVRVTAPPFVPATEGLPGLGLNTDAISGLTARGLAWIDRERVPAWSPQATVLADADFAGITWSGLLVNVNHGLISKGWYYTAKPGVLRENQADLICVPGPYHAEVLSSVLCTPVVATGLVKFDAVGRGELTRATAREMLAIPHDVELVTLAPTFNIELSAVPVLTGRVRELVGGNRHLAIKLHGMSPPVWTRLFRTLARLDSRIHLVESQDLTPALVAADVVISDVSSAFMEAIALDRPVVLVDSPLQTRYFNYDPHDIEYAWRHVGLRARTADETLLQVERALANPLEKAELRREYGHKLVGVIDGHASQRAARAILARIGDRTPAPLSTVPG